MIDHMHPSADVDMELEDEQELEEQQEGEIDEEQRAEEEDEKESSEEEDDDEGEEEEKEETAEETPEEDADGPDFQGALDTLGDSVDNVLHAPLGPHMGALEAAYNDLYVTLAGKMNALEVEEVDVGEKMDQIKASFGDFKENMRALLGMGPSQGGP